MRNITFFSVILGLVFVFSSCGTEPTDLGTSTSALSWKKSGNSKHFNHTNYKNYKRMLESFEAYSDGSILPDKYHWVSGGKAFGKVTNTTARENKKQSLHMELPQDLTGATYLGSKFCLNGSVDTYLHVKFSINFGNFVNWTAMGLSDGTAAQYWWWTRANGTIFDDTTFDTFTPNAWNDVEIVIDRDRDLATVTIQGRTHYVGLAVTYPYTNAATPMQCLFFLASSSGDAQNLFVDDIVVLGH
jgi:hypothetical protein